jgi:hypothetical protein
MKKEANPSEPVGRRKCLICGIIPLLGGSQEKNVGEENNV